MGQHRIIQRKFMTFLSPQSDNTANLSRLYGALEIAEERYWQTMDEQWAQKAQSLRERIQSVESRYKCANDYLY